MVVHQHAWITWQARLSQKPLYSLSAGEIQEPGVIPEDVMTDLDHIVSELPPRKKYTKMN